MLEVADDAMEARLRGRLFGDQPKAYIGVFELHARIGSGGMGDVFSAVDPRLQRKVALKVIRPQARSAHARAQIEQRLRREARALAQLDHPNIVRVFDVGTHDGKLFMAMEFVDGATLRRWLIDASPSVDAIVAVFVEVGRALAAAHDAGLVHRDVKPDNVVVDASGRARVLDFGLALIFRQGTPPSEERGSERADASTESEPAEANELRTRGLVGTPGYMAPEQYLRHEPDPATDQFSFCVALYEALYGRSPIPRRSFAQARDATVQGRIDVPPRGKAPAWLTRIVMRGLALSPGDRWPSMAALVQALNDGERRGSRALVALAAVVAAAGLTGVAFGGTADSGCPDPTTTTTELWGGARQQRIASRFETAGEFGTTLWGQLQPRVDSYVRGLVRELDAVCRADPDHELSRDRAHLCLRDAQAHLDAALSVLAEADLAVVEHAHAVVDGLPPTADCLADGTRRLSDSDDPRAAELRTRLSQLRVRIAAGQYETTDTEASQIVASARELSDAGLIAEALLTRGHQQLEAGHAVTARATLQEAYFGAARLDAHAVAAEAATHLVHAALEAGDELEDGLQWGRHGHAALDVAPKGKARARLLITEAHLLRELGRTTEAIERAERAVNTLADEVGAESVYEASAQHVLAVVLSDAGDYAAATTHYEAALAGLRTSLGPRHPDTAATMANLGTLLQRSGRYVDAERMHRDALEIRREQLRADHPVVVGALINIATAVYSQGRAEQARALFEAVVDTVGDGEMSSHPDFAWALNNLGALRWHNGDPEAGRRSVTRALRIFERAYGAHHSAVAGTCNNLGLMALEQHRLDDARDLFIRSIGVYRDIHGPEHPEVANLTGNLARLALAKNDVSEALRLTERALQIRQRMLGAEHPDTANSMMLRGEALRRAARFDDALVMVDRARAIYVLRQTADALPKIEALRRRIEDEQMASSAAVARAGRIPQ